jgi:Zn-dependent M28 family amino/carboxypeptidase
MLRFVFGAAEPELSPLDPEVAARTAAVRAAIDPSQLRRSLERLPAPRVRLLNPEAMAAADALILDSFRSAGWPAELRAFEEPAPDGARGAPDLAPALRLSGVNVVSIKNGESRDAVVVVAHHDTVPDTGGADDNGSGVVALMELARLLGSLRLRRTVVLAAVDHEELGFWGARRLVRELSAERRVVGAFVFEMLAYTDSTPGSQQLPKGIGAVYRDQVRKVRARDFRGDFTAVIYQQSARPLATCFAECLDLLAGPAATILLRAPSDLPVIGPLLARTLPFVRDFARSDHVAFWEAGLPAMQITDTANFRNPHYHRPSDTPGTLDYDRLADVIAAAAVAVERVAAR